MVLTSLVEPLPLPVALRLLAPPPWGAPCLAGPRPASMEIQLEPLPLPPLAAGACSVHLVSGWFPKHLVHWCARPAGQSVPLQLPLLYLKQSSVPAALWVCA